ncbi:virulence plasmid A protein [Chitinophaga skermanii]|uniref:Virulence plasmid A protein n=1 Tax=Chitinophaga skermanii TaxID=331697 RepID=A0A327QYQ0_9BACT|nr:neuraminidase-like domain-containing protein [Chitinophaga skermanii]RAJ08888.1 virulence plasmid A protein [Chitinophaga skermanii]
MLPSIKQYGITGRITDLANQPYPGLTVQLAGNAAAPAPSLLSVPNGSIALTDNNGMYSFSFDANDFQQAFVRSDEGDFTLSIFNGNTLIHTATCKCNPNKLEVVDIKLTIQIKAGDENIYTVAGIVRNEFGELLDAVKIEAFDRDLRAEQLLGTATIKNGIFSIAYKREQFTKAEKLSADLVLRVYGKNNMVIHNTSIHFNAPQQLDVVINIEDNNYQGLTSFETCEVIFTPLLDGLAVLDLKENEQYQDISFLEGETQQSIELILSWIAAYHLEEVAKSIGFPLDAVTFFAYVKQGLPGFVTNDLLRDLLDTQKVSVVANKLLKDCSNIPNEEHTNIINTAINNNLVPAKLKINIDSIANTFNNMKLYYAANEIGKGGGKGTVGELIALTPNVANKQSEFMAALVDHVGSLDDLWVKLKDEKLFDDEDIKGVKLSMEIGMLTRNYLPLVAALRDKIMKGEITKKQELAAYDVEDWIAILKSNGPDGKVIGAPANMDGETAAEKLEQYATILDKMFERNYPTAAFSSRFKKTKQLRKSLVATESPIHKLIPETADVSTFLDQNPGFFLDEHRVDAYIAETPGALDNIVDAEATVKAVKTIQRGFKLQPTFQAVDAMLNKDISSAQQIYFMGSEQFAAEMEDAGLSSVECRKIYHRAENTYAMVLSLFGTFNAAMNGSLPAAVPAQVTGEQQPANEKSLAATMGIAAALPNLKSLFGSQDYCECKACRSVYSAAAYFVDMNRFLLERNANYGKVFDVLNNRRPDLGYMELTCENTNTPMPYIDLVNEVLEEAVSNAPSMSYNNLPIAAGRISTAMYTALSNNFIISDKAEVAPPDKIGMWTIRDKNTSLRAYISGTYLLVWETKQTKLTKEELLVTPAYTNRAAYTKLESQVFPFTMPFSLPFQQARVYFEQMGTTQPAFLQLFQQRNVVNNVEVFSPVEYNIGLSILGMTEIEAQIIANNYPAKKAWEFWGLRENDNNLFHPASPNDTTTNIKGTWLAVLSKVPILLNRTGLAYKELLQVLQLPFVNPTGTVYINDIPDTTNTANCDVNLFTVVGLTADVLSRIHRFVRLWRRLGGKMYELDMALPYVDVANPSAGKLLNESVLLSLSKVYSIKERFGLSWPEVLVLHNNIDHTAYLDYNNTESTPVTTLYETLFRNKKVGVPLIFPANPKEINRPISYYLPVMHAGMGISEQSLLSVIGDLGLSVNATMDYGMLSNIYRHVVLAKWLDLQPRDVMRLKQLWGKNPFESPANTLAFVELIDKVKGNAFSIAEVNYLLANQLSLNEGVGLDNKVITQNIQLLRDGLVKIADDVALKTGESLEAYIQSKLGLLPNLKTDADLSKAFAIVTGTWNDTETEKASTLIDNYFTGVLTIADAKTKLAATPEGLPKAERLAYFQPALQAWLLNTQQQAFVKQCLSEILQVDGVLTNLLLSELKLNNTNIPLVQNFVDTRLLEKITNGSFKFDIVETNFPAIYNSLRLLDKLALIITKLKIQSEELQWWLVESNAQSIGWMLANKIPIDATSTVQMSTWINLVDHFKWRSRLPKSTISITEWLNMLNNPASSDPGIVKALATLTGWNEQDMMSCITAFTWLPRTAFKTAGNLLRLTQCMETVQQIGVSAQRVITWAKHIPTFEIVENIKQAIKAKYDWSQWQVILQPIQDKFRVQKRDALLSYLLHNPNGSTQQWTDVNGVYNYFLIDVEMSPMMLTSRLKQAIASTQLFVQRCFLNLEPMVVVNAAYDAKWNQWDWMKYYRVWEANRKVFLYPENWIEPELRDEKSSIFTELEDELMQHEMTNESANRAFINFVDKLEDIANLETRAIFNEVNGSQNILHVLARTRGSAAPSYYYRKRINKGRWTPWTKIPLDINSNHLQIAVYNERVSIMWPQFIEKAYDPTVMNIPSAGSNITLARPQKYWEISMCWSELIDGKWTAKTVTNTNLQIPFATVGEDPSNINFRARIGSNFDMKVFRGVDYQAQYGDMSFRKYGKQMTVTPVQGEFMLSSNNTGFKNNLIQHFTQYCEFYYAAVLGDAPVNLYPQVLQNRFKVLNNTQAKSHSVIDASASNFPYATSYFYWDALHNYNVDFIGENYRDYDYYSRQWVYYQNATINFYIHYHPYAGVFVKEATNKGVKGVLNRRIQLFPEQFNGYNRFNFASYSPSDYVKPIYKDKNGNLAFPTEDIDFSYTGAYSSYNWELFFHVPFYIANKLATNQRFEEALNWYHYIFNPTSTDTAYTDQNTPQQKYWITKPFFETTKADYYKSRIDSLMTAIAKNEAAYVEQVKEWRDNPFNPHLIARMRTVAYQKNVLIKYIQTIIAWGDQLFRQNTTESINEATQLYVLADSVLGQRPQSVQRNTGVPVRNFLQIVQEGIDAFGNALVDVENILPGIPTSSGGTISQPALPRLDTLCFGIPNNEKLLTLWDTVADRLFKIRHSMNIDGVTQQLPLFDPPIDPAALVKAAAGGLNIGSVLADVNAPLPLYRFRFTIQRAIELCNEVKSLGNLLLSVLERKDGEAFAQLRATQEMNLLANMRSIKGLQIEEAKRSYEGLLEAKKIIQERLEYYKKLGANGLSAGEKKAGDKSRASSEIENAIALGYTLAAGVKLIPDFLAGVAGVGGSPTVNASLGGDQLGGSAELAVATLKSIAAALDKQAGVALTAANYERRKEEWAFQQKLAEKEIPQVDLQILAAEIRQSIANKDLQQHDKQVDNLAKEFEYMQSKFTNRELYDWMSSQLATVYFQCYQHAFDLAKRAEKCFRYEMGISTSNYIQFGYWDSLKKGLLCGEKLYQDLRRLESAYYEQHRRTYELTKHVSLSLLDPVALLQLKTNGECFIDIPESLFDMDYPGHYFRRLKTVGLTIPCIAGPYTTIACTLTLTSNKLRKDATFTSNGKYARDYNIDDPRFRDEIAGIQSIATSSAQNDNGLFELNFGDERYLPFEGAGAISTWHLKLNKQIRQFDFDSIADVVLHLSYTAREGGEALAAKVNAELKQQLNEQVLAANKKGLFRVFDIKQEFSTAWSQFILPANGGEQTLQLSQLATRLPYFTRAFNQKKASQITVVARMKNSSKNYQVCLSPLGTQEADFLTMAPTESYGGLHFASKTLPQGTAININDWTMKIKEANASDFTSLPADAVMDVYLIINYSIA